MNRRMFEEVQRLGYVDRDKHYISVYRRAGLKVRRRAGASQTQRQDGSGDTEISRTLDEKRSVRFPFLRWCLPPQSSGLIMWLVYQS